MNLNNFKVFLIDDLFDTKKGSLIGAKKNTLKSGTKVISANTNNNGFSHYIKSKPEFSGNVFTIANTGQGSVGIVFYQDEPFIPTNNVTVLIPKFKLNKTLAMFFLPIFRMERYRLSFGRVLNEKRLKNHPIKLPVDKYGKPEFKLIEEFIKKIDRTKLLEKNIDNLKKSILEEKISLEEKKMKFFEYKKIFDIKKGKRFVVSKNTKSGLCPFVSSIDKNNGVSNYLSISPNHKHNTITVNYDGSVGESFYQDTDFWAADSVNVLYPKFNINPFVAMFLLVMIKKEKYRFNYGRKWHKERMEVSKIKLPINNEGSPDWQFMEDYIKSLPYSKALEN